MKPLTDPFGHDGSHMNLTRGLTICDSPETLSATCQVSLAVSAAGNQLNTPTARPKREVTRK